MPLFPTTRLPSPYGSDRLVRLAARLRPALCDTLITVGSQEFPAHSLVLAGVSQQLGRRGRWALVKGISPSTFAQLLYFVYGESVELQPGELGPLEEAARALGVQSLEEACRRARWDRARELGPGLKEHQEEPEKPTRDSERGLEGHGEQRPEQFVKAGWRERETLHEQSPPRESPEIAEAMQEGAGEQMRSKEKLKQSPFGHGGTDGKQEVIMWVTESPGGSEESLREFSGPLPPPGSLQTSVIPRPWWAEAPWLGTGQPALWSILLLPPRYGTPFSHSTPITGAWQEVWRRDQRIPLSLNPEKGLWNQNQLANSSPAPGSLPQGPTKLSLGEMEESDQRHTGALASCVGHVSTAGPSLQQPPPPPPARSRPYSCSVCGKRFSLKHQLETHYRVHTGEKPFSCSLCPQRSRDFSAMTKHLRTHGAAPYRCPLCRAGCPSLASMQAHMRGHSPSQLPPGWTIRSTFLYSSSSRPSRASTSPCRSPSSTT
ncbi:zinc finger and BTB domain-containing protein 32 isoform X1 [Ailuropoda melanoleuca]|uniref:Zinc finger and BTB domain-containing protein 32 n=3 Tax=Ailuropoda melanoleuca TaxID=9646 RepID=G1L158_AILME|nr:zinc finger and BTB domain-containing protein 32 isoform X1 [Ailuropoda melanoleuca]XP_034494270.1 zinc finger and BTB domain-containing protein 32 isoform X1 [Ailuropoda melanoleuca]XP_034494271.1 zinc finger and BTB domain-containing protein 32 isoform X1 [Ailuropoda melanoleuca]